MGKSKQKRFRAKQPNPTGLPSVKDFDKEIELSGELTSVLEPIIEQLSSINEETRECGCASIANLVAVPENIKTLLQKDCIKILAPLFVDPSPQVSVKALGAVRNITVDGGPTACELLIKKDVLTPLVSLLNKFGVGWNPEEVSVKKLKDIKIEIFTEATHILWNLCESSGEAVNVFNRENLITILWPCLQYKVYGYDLAITVAQCVYSVTEDNNELIEKCRQLDKICLLGIIADDTLSSQHALLKTLAVGILTNINDQSPTNHLGVAMQTLAQVLMVDAVEVLKHDLQEGQQGSANGDGNPESKQQVEKNTENIISLLKAQQTALEIVTNLSCEDDEWEELDTSESSSDDMAVDVDMEQSCMATDSDWSKDVQKAISSNHIFNKVLQKIEPVDITPFIKNVKNQSDILKNFEQLQIYGLLCCNNLVSSLDAECLGGLENLHNVWTGLVKLSSADSVKCNLSLLEAVTSCMRAIVQKLADLESPKLLEMTSQDLQYLYEVEQQCPQSEVKVNVVRIVATIGCVFAKIPQPHPFLKDVGLFLLEVCCKENDLRVIAESLDSIFDVFGEDHLDPIVKDIQMVPRLKALLPNLKSQVQGRKKQLGEHYPVISTARINLVRFIKYKSP